MDCIICHGPFVPKFHLDHSRICKVCDYHRRESSEIADANFVHQYGSFNEGPIRPARGIFWAMVFGAVCWFAGFGTAFLLILGG